MDAASQQSDGSLGPSESWLRSIAGALGPGSARASAWIARGTIVDDCYRIERALAAGGMAVVYLAHDLELDRKVALKLYDVDARELSLSRIYREARAMARLSHPNVLVVHGVGVHEQRVFLAMEYVEGETLRGWLAQTRPAWPQIVEVFVACARGLAAAHAVGLAHGDFKPDNVLMGRDGRPRVADFGLAQTIGSAWERDDHSSDRARGTERFVGTRGYAAPEILRGAPVDERADQFALCVALHEALYGVHPFEGDDLDAQVEAVRDGRLRARPSAHVPARIHQVIARGLAPDPADRFPTLEDLVSAIVHDPWRGRSRIAIGIAMVAGAGVLTLAWPRGPACDLAGDSVAESWSPARSAALAQSFVDSGSPIASSAHAAVGERLDRWAEGWRAQRVDACEATRVRGEQSELLLDRRMLCLDRLRAQLDSTIAVFAAADREVVARAEDLAAALPDPQRCGELDRLLAQVAPPEDPALAAAVEAARRELADVRVAIDVGRYAEAAEEADRVHAGASARHHAPLRAEAGLLLGVARGRALEHEAGELALTEAFHEATAAGDDATAASAARELVCNLAQVSGGNARAQWWARLAESTGTRSGEDEEARLQRRSCEGLSLHAAGEFAAAEVVFRAAIDEAELLPDSLVAAQLHDRLGSTLSMLEHNAAAADEHERAIELAAALRGPSHPLVLGARSNLAQDLIELDRRGEALAIQLDVLQTLIALVGPQSPRLVVQYNKVAMVLNDVGALPQALAYRATGIAIARARGDQDRALVVLLAGQATDLDASGHAAEALALLAEAVAVSERALGPNHADTGKARVNYGALLAKAERSDDAEVELRAGSEILEQAFGEHHPTLGVVHLNLAQLARDRGRDEQAARELAAALRIAELAGDRKLSAFVTMTQADLARARGDRPTARTLQMKAIELLEGVDAVMQRAAVFQLAEDDLARGDATAGLQGFERARELARTQAAIPRVAAAELGMANAAWALARKADARRWAQSAQAHFVAIDDREGVETCRTWFAQHH